MSNPRERVYGQHPEEIRAIYFEDEEALYRRLCQALLSNVHGHEDGTGHPLPRTLEEEASNILANYRLSRGFPIQGGFGQWTTDACWRPSTVACQALMRRIQSLHIQAQTP